jgi:predicted dehydrogenase
MSTRCKVLIVGCGRIAASHLEAVLLSPLTEVAALVDPVAARAQALAERFGIEPRIATDVDAALSEADAAIIATPNHTHAAIAEQCLARRVGVLIEKPLAMTTSEGDRICEAARRSGATVAVGYVTRFRESVSLMRRLIADRHFGTIRRFAYQFGTKGGWAPLSAYNLDRRTSGGGVLVTTGTHFIDRMLYWFGFPEDAWLVDDAAGGPEANAEAHFMFRDGVRGIARFSKTVAMPAGFVMETDMGLVILKDGADATIVVRPSDQSDLEMTIASRRRAANGNEFVQQLEDFVRATRGERAPMVSGEQGIESLRLLEQLYKNRAGQRSAHNRQPAGSPS